VSKEKHNPDNSFLQGVKEAVADEMAAVSFYSQLANMAPNPVIADRIRCIIQDEMGHAEFFALLLSLLSAWRTEEMEECD